MVTYSNIRMEDQQTNALVDREMRDIGRDTFFCPKMRVFTLSVAQFVTFLLFLLAWGSVSFISLVGSQRTRWIRHSCPSELKKKTIYAD